MTVGFLLCGIFVWAFIKEPSTGQDAIAARNAIDERQQYFVVNDELLLPILKTSTQCTCALHATGNA
jgi:hypothetical protein